jgi:hypothetical protein
MRPPGAVLFPAGYNRFPAAGVRRTGWMVKNGSFPPTERVIYPGPDVAGNKNLLFCLSLVGNV